MKRRNGARWIVARTSASFVLALITCGVPSPSLSEKGRTLGGYRFIPSTRIEAPFITTHFRNSTGISWASDVEFPILVIPTIPPDTLLALNGNFLFVVANFEYQYAVHPRVALHVLASGASRVGASSEALLSQGVTVLRGTKLGAVIELWRNDRVLLSAGADLGYLDGLVIDFVQFAEDILAGKFKDASLIKQEEGVRGNASFRVAWAWNRWSGLNGLGQIGFAETGALADEVLWRFGISGSADFGQRGNAPVGVQLDFDIDRLSPQTADIYTAIGVGGGVYYTGRKDLNLGVDIEWSRWPLQNWDSVAYPISFGVSLRYFF